MNSELKWMYGIGVRPCKKIGNEEGDTCNRDGCKGKLKFTYMGDPEYAHCSCHTCAPCSYCVNQVLNCNKCGWHDEIEENEPVDTSIYLVELPKAKYEDDGKKYRVAQYFDCVFEGYKCEPTTKPNAHKVLDDLYKTPRHYVSFSVVPA